MGRSTNTHGLTQRSTSSRPTTQTRLPEAKRFRLPGTVLRTQARRRRRIPIFLRAISRMSTTRKISLAAVLLAVSAIWPVTSSACTSDAKTNAATAEVRALARKINSLGFDQLSVTGKQTFDRDIVATPFSTWYLDQFGDSRERRDSVVATLLDEVTKGIVFSASVGANRATTSFTQKDANEAHQVLCASTSWSPEGDYDLSVVLSLRGDLTFSMGPLSEYEELPFFNDGAVSGLRLDSNNGNALLLFWSTSGHEDDLRNILSDGRWDIVTAEFHEARTLIDAISFDRKVNAVLRPDSLSGFDTTVAPSASAWDALPTSLELSVNSAGARFQIDEDLYAYSTKPKRVMINGKTVSIGSIHFASSDFPPQTPRSHRFSSLGPLVYAVVNRATGCILLVGFHS
jgi:hypothetical protein